jgi:hypothetical protein
MGNRDARGREVKKPKKAKDKVVMPSRPRHERPSGQPANPPSSSVPPATPGKTDA